MNEPTASPAESPPTEPTFDVLPLGAEVRRAIDEMGYRNPTPVQRAVFEPAAEGRSLVVQARTGTGKTAAFGLPIVDRLVRPSVKAVQALVLCPTRELALQVSREIEQLGKYRGTKVVAIYGGAPMSKQIEALEAGAQIVVGTPGRVLDHLRRKTLDPSGVRVLVLDEADEMLSMGFARELHAILETLPKNRQGLFFSATIPPDIERLAARAAQEPRAHHALERPGRRAADRALRLRDRGGDKRDQLVRILEVEDPESAVVFCNTRDETERVAEALKTRGLRRRLAQRRPPAERPRAGHGAPRARGACASSSRPTWRRAGSTSRTSRTSSTTTSPRPPSSTCTAPGRTGRAGRTGTAISIVGPKDIGNLYLLRLTYKIRPIEKQLPSAGELKTRAEMDVLQLFVDAFAGRPVHVDDLSLARRLLTHEDAERIIAGLLRDHLGARGGDARRRGGRGPPRAQSSAAAGSEGGRAAARGRRATRGCDAGRRGDRPIGARSSPMPRSRRRATPRATTRAAAARAHGAAGRARRFVLALAAAARARRRQADPRTAPDAQTLRRAFRASRCPTSPSRSEPHARRTAETARAVGRRTTAAADEDAAHLTTTPSCSSSSTWENATACAPSTYRSSCRTAASPSTPAAGIRDARSHDLRSRAQRTFR